MAKMQNLASFIKKNFNIIQTSTLALILLFLEKVMDMEFVCPWHIKGLAIGYSLVFLIIPAAIVCIVTQYFSSSSMCCKKKAQKTSNADGNKANEQEKTPLNKAIGDEKTCCFSQRQWDTCKTFLNDYKAILFWVILIFTDGKYMECLVKSVSTEDINCTQPKSGCPPLQDVPVIQICQIIGLSIVLVVICARFCCRSRWHEMRNEDIMVQATEDTIEEQLKVKREAYVMNILNRQDWENFNPGHPEALVQVKIITDRCRNEVKNACKSKQSKDPVVASADPSADPSANPSADPSARFG